MATASKLTGRAAAVQPLENGDRIPTREEFHARYLEHPEIKRAEYLDGVVYVPSPVSLQHGNAHAVIVGWLVAYATGQPGVIVGDNVTVYLPGGGEVQPDGLLFRANAANATAADDGYLRGAPELVVEVAASSASYDLHVKKDAYRRAGVREYVAWRTFDRQIDWWRLQDGAYVPLDPGEGGVVESREFPGLRMKPALAATGDPAGLFLGGA